MFPGDTRGFGLSHASRTDLTRRLAVLPGGWRVGEARQGWVSRPSGHGGARGGDWRGVSWPLSGSWRPCREDLLWTFSSSRSTRAGRKQMAAAVRIKYGKSDY